MPLGANGLGDDACASFTLLRAGQREAASSTLLGADGEVRAAAVLWVYDACGMSRPFRNHA